MKSLFVLLLAISIKTFCQQPYSASFVAKLGNDTVIVETYNMLHNHLYGKAFLRYPEDQVAVFNYHFFPDGSIQHYSVSFMNTDSSYITSSGTQGVVCNGDSCTWFAAWRGTDQEYTNKYAIKHLDFIGGWTPTLSLIEWNCIRLLQSGQKSLPLTLLNDYIGAKDIAIYKGNKDTILFGGPFLEYTKITTTPEGRIVTYDGTTTPWSYIVTKHNPIDVDAVSKRLSKTAKIGVPSPEVKMKFPVAGDTITLSYGSPAKRGRKIFGGVVPYDSVWRTGAGDPTKITLPTPIRIGNSVIGKGEYSLYSIPRANEWILIFNTNLQQWPTDPDRSADVAQVAIKVRKLNASRERFAIHIEPTKSGGVIKFSWDETEAFANFEVLNNKHKSAH